MPNSAAAAHSRAAASTNAFIAHPHRARTLPTMAALRGSRHARISWNAPRKPGPVRPNKPGKRWQRAFDLQWIDERWSDPRSCSDTRVGTGRDRSRVMSCDTVRRLLVGGWFVVALVLFVLVVTRAPLGQIVHACGAMGPAVLLAPAVAWNSRSPGTRTRTSCSRSDAPSRGVRSSASASSVTGTTHWCRPRGSPVSRTS